MSFVLLRRNDRTWWKSEEEGEEGREGEGIEAKGRQEVTLALEMSIWRVNNMHYCLQMFGC